MNETDLNIKAQAVKMLCDAAKFEANEGNVDSALQILANAESEWEKYPEIGKETLFFIHQSKGNILFDNGCYQEALGEFDNCLDIAESMNLYVDIGIAHYHRGLIFFKMKKFEDAEIEYHLSMKAYLENFDSEFDVTRRLAMVWNKLGDIHKVMGKYDMALHDNAMELDLCKILAEKDDRQRVCVACTYDNIGEIYSLKCEYSKAIENYSAAIDIFKRVIATGGPDCSLELKNTIDAMRKIIPA